jgi:hypothetical protein
MKSIHWKRFVPFIFYTALVIASSAAALASEDRPLWSTALLVAAGVLIWQPMEYCLHRFAFHFDAKSERGRKFVYDSHLVHHESPNTLDDIFANLSTSLPVASVYCLAAWAVTGSWQAAVWLFAGLIAGYFFYEWMHYQAHHRSPCFAFLRWMKKYHMLHHHKSMELRFGVTSPVMDLLFGTFGPVGKRSRSDRGRAEVAGGPVVR